jgi:hypothetical protein
MKPSVFRTTLFSVLAAVALVNAAPSDAPGTAADEAASTNQVLEWNQIFIDTLIATNTANSSSQRLGAIVHTAIFDAYNGVERRYTPIFAHPGPPLVRRAERRSLLPPTLRWAACFRHGRQHSMPAMPYRWRRSASAVGGTSDRSDAAAGARSVSNAALSGALRSRRLFLPGARRMASARATQPLPAGPPSASGDPRRRRSDR